MSSAGHVLDMIVRMRNNRNLINKNRHFNYKKKYKQHLEISREKFKKITSEERLRIKELILKQRRREIYRKIFSFIVALLFTGLFMYFLLFSEIKISDEFLF